MSNKLFLVSVALAFFFLLANASIYRTVLEFDEEDDDTNPVGPLGPRQKCRKEFQQEQHLRACQRWMRKRMNRGRSPSELDVEDEFDDIEDDNDENRRGPHQQHPLLQKCCQELRQEDPVCVCPTLKQAAKAVRLQGQHQPGPRQVRRIYRTAKNLPDVCNIQEVDVCPFRARPYFPPYY